MARARVGRPLSVATETHQPVTTAHQNDQDGLASIFRKEEPTPTDSTPGPTSAAISTRRRRRLTKQRKAGGSRTKAVQRISQTGQVAIAVAGLALFVLTVSLASKIALVIRAKAQDGATLRPVEDLLKEYQHDAWAWPATDLPGESLEEDVELLKKALETNGELSRMFLPKLKWLEEKMATTEGDEGRLMTLRIQTLYLIVDAGLSAVTIEQMRKVTEWTTELKNVAKEKLDFIENRMLFVEEKAADSAVRSLMLSHSVTGQRLGDLIRFMEYERSALSGIAQERIASCSKLRKEIGDSATGESSSANTVLKKKALAEQAITKLLKFIESTPELPEFLTMPWTDVFTPKP